MRQAEDHQKPSYAVRNQILSTMPSDLFLKLQPFLRLVDIDRHTFLDSLSRPADAAYFIESGVVSRMERSQSGSVEVAMAGRSGFIGVSIVLGVLVPLRRTVVVVPGKALRISAEQLRSIMSDDPLIREHLIHYVYLMMRQRAQMALCNASHDIDKRVARWLLVAYGEADIAEFPVTHDLLATMLAVRRPSVSEALASLEEKGIVAKARGTLCVVDPVALRSRACECHCILDDSSLPLRARQLNHHRLV